MLDITLQRISPLPKQIQFGILIVANQPRWITLELPYLDNEKKKSRNRRAGNLKLAVTFEVLAVPNRDGILLHPGNLPRDTEGCILIGKGLGDVEGLPGITSSKQGFQEFLDYTEKDESFRLIVRTYAGNTY
jgi:hypothetical protein